MPRRGEYAEFKDVPPEQRQFAEAVRSLRDALPGMTLKMIGAELRMSSTKLSDLMNGKRKRPDQGDLKDIYDFAAKNAEASHLPLAPWASLEARRQAVVDSCALERQRRRKLRALPDRETQAPVPLGEGDRRHTETHSPVWPGIDDLVQRIDSGRDEDVAVVVMNTARSADPKETAAAIAVCHARGLVDVAGDLVTYATRRDWEDRARVAKTLIQYGHSDLAEDLLEASAPG